MGETRGTLVSIDGEDRGEGNCVSCRDVIKGPRRKKHARSEIDRKSNS